MLSKLTLELPKQSVHVSRASWPTDVVLADPTFDRPGSIDLILGEDIFYDLLRDGQFKSGGGELMLQNTALGWVVSGKVSAKVPVMSVSNDAHITSNPSIEDQPPCYLGTVPHPEHTLRRKTGMREVFRKNDRTGSCWSFYRRSSNESIGDLQARELQRHCGSSILHPGVSA